MSPLGTAYRPAGKLGLGPAFLMLWIVALALFPGQWSMPVTDRDEARYSQAATQMMETGDYVDIRFQEKPRYVKPAGIYWMQVASTQAFGGPDAPIGAYRIPSYLGILIISLGTALIGARIMGGTYGAIAGGIFGLTLLAGAEGRIAKTDAMLVAAGTMAQLGLFNILVQPKGSPARQFRTWPLLFWFASGLAVLIKGPIFAIFSLATILVYVGVSRDWRALRRLRPLPGLAVFAVVGLTWVGLITYQSDGEFLRESVGHALLGKVAEGDDAHGGPPGYHLIATLVMFWPGTIFLGLAGAAAIRRRKDPAVLFLLAWLIPGWLVYEAVATKLPHYVMPAYPALAVLCALGIKDAIEGAKTGLAHGVGLVLFALGSVALPVAAYFAIADIDGQFATPWILAMVGAIVLTLIIGIARLRKPSFDGLALTAVPVVAFYAFFAEGALPRLSVMWPSHSVWQVAAQIEGCDELRFATAGYREPSNVFYLGTDTILGDGADAAQLLLDNPSCGVAIVDRREREAFDAALGAAAIRELSIVEGTNVVKGRSLTLAVIVRAESDLMLGTAQPRRL
ncbi:MAG: glycosyltransferase family 39 protein [Pseudomonadota bacterium]